MGQERLNALAICNIHKDLTDGLNVDQLCDTVSQKNGGKAQNIFFETCQCGCGLVSRWSNSSEDRVSRDM